MKKQPSASLFLKAAASLFAVSTVASGSVPIVGHDYSNVGYSNSEAIALSPGSNELRLHYSYAGTGPERVAYQNGEITGTGTLVINGTHNNNSGGILVLSSSANNYIGATVIQNATLRLTGSLSAGSYNGEIVLQEGVLDLQTSSQQRLSGNISGTGNLYVKGQYSIVLEAGSTNNFTGQTIVWSGSKLIAGNGTLSANSSLTLLGTLETNNVFQSTGSLSGVDTAKITFGGNGSLTVNQTTPATYTGTLEGGNGSGFTKTGTEVLRLNGNLADFAGEFVVSNGVLALASSTNLRLPTAFTSLNLSNEGEFNISGLANNTTLTVKSFSSSSSNSKLVLGDRKHFQVGVVGENKYETFAGTISGFSQSSFNKNGAGALTLTNAHDGFAGQFTVLGGTLALAGTASIAEASGLRLDDGTTFDISGTNTGATVKNLLLLPGQNGTGTEIKLGARTLTVVNGGTFAGTITSNSPASGLVLNGPQVNSTLTLSGRNTYTGSTTVSGGLLKITGALGTGMGGNNYAGNIALTGGNISFDQQENQRLNGIISGSGALTKNGGGTLELANANTYTGATHVSGGTLALTGTLGADVANDYTGQISIVASTFLVSQASAATTQTLSGNITGNGSLVKIGAGTLVLSGSNYGTNANANGFLTTINGGTLDIAAPTNLGRGVNSLDNATLRLSGATDTNYFNAWSIGQNGGTLSVVNDVTLSGALYGGGSVTKNGPGTLTLSGNNIGIGDFTVSAGGVAIRVDANLGSGVNTLANGATLSLTGGSYTKSWTIGTGGGIISTDVAGSRFHGDISGTGTLAKTGSGALEIHGEVSVPLAVRQGTLAGTGSVGRVTLDPGTTLSPGIYAPGVRETPIGTLHLGDNTGTTALNGITLRVNLFGTSSSDLVEISGNAAFGLGASAQNTVDIYGAGATWGTGEYTILQTTGTLASGDLSQTAFQYAGVTIDTANSRLRATLTPVANVDADGNINGGNRLVLNTYASSSIQLTWNQGSRNTDAWNKGEGAPANWHENGTPGRTFADGDVVHFADQPGVQKNVVIATEYEGTSTAHKGVVVGGMSVSGTKFFFSGGKINGLATGATGPGVNADGKLVIHENASAYFSNSLAFVGVDVAGEGTFAGETSTSTLAIAPTGKFTRADGGILTAPKVVNDGIIVFDRSASSASIGTAYDTFAGSIEGSGSLEKTGTGLLTLTGTSTYTGETKVFGGTLAIASDNNIGTGKNTLNNGTLQLSGRYYEKDWVLGTAGGTVEFNTTRNQNISTFNGAIGGDGPLTKSGTGILQLASANTYTGTTNVKGGFLEITGLLGAPDNAILPPEAPGSGEPLAAPVPLRLSPNAVGNYAGNIILDGGRVNFDSSNDQILTGTISNKPDAEGNKQGTLGKNGEGLLKLEGAGKNHNFDKFIATKGETVVEGALHVNTLENGVANPAVGSQSVRFTASTVNVGTLINYASGDFTAETIHTVSGTENFGTLTAKAINGNFTNRRDAQLDLVATQPRALINGTLNNSGLVKFSAPGQVLEVKSLNNATAQMGTFELVVDFASPERSNFIKVADNGAVTGHHLFRVTPENLDAVTGHTHFDLVQGGQIADNATFFLERPIIAGLYEIGMGGANDTALQVVGYSPLGKTFLNATAMISTSWFSQLDNLSKRQGNLRLALLAANNASSAINADEYKPGTLDAADSESSAWIRAYGQQVSAKLGIKHVPEFKEYQGGADVGYDYGISLNSNNKLFIGAFVGFQASARNFNDGYDSRSDSRSILGGFYGTWAHSNGWFVDATIKAQRIYTEYRLNYSGSGRNAGDYHQDGIGFSIEAGKRFELGDAWFIEPSFRFAMSHFMKENVSPAEDLKINMGASTAIRYGILLGLGKVFTINKKTSEYVQPYLKAGLDGQSSNGGRINIDASSEATSLDVNTNDIQGTVGLGVAWQLDASQQLHVDYEASFGGKFTRPWVVNVGYNIRF